MPTGPKGEKRPADVIGNAVRVMRIATGDEAEVPTGVSREARVLGQAGGKKRAEVVSPEKRKAIAVKAAKARWQAPSDA